MIERIHPEEGPEGLMLAVANAHDDTFRWRVAAAVVQEARIIDMADHRDQASRVIWRWNEVGEVFARYFALALEMTPTVTDDQIREAVQKNWDLIMAGMPPQGVADAEP